MNSKLLFYIITLNLVTISSTIFSQTPTGEELKWSKPIKSAKALRVSADINYGMDISGFNDDYFVVEAESNKDPNITIMDITDLSIVKTFEEYRPLYKGKKYFFKASKVFHDKILIVSATKINPKLAVLDYIIQVCSLPNLNVEETIEVGNAMDYCNGVPRSTYGNVYNYYNEPLFFKNPEPAIEFIESENGEHLVLIFTNTPAKGTPIKYLYYTFDKEMEFKRIEKSISGVLRKKYQRQNIFFSNDGDLYMIYLQVVSTKRINRYFYDFSNSQKVLLEGEEYSPITQKIYEHNNKIMITGNSIVNGGFSLFITEYDAEDIKFLDPLLVPVDVSQTLIYRDKKTIEKFKKKPKELPFLNFYIDNLKYIDNGDILIYGESYQHIGSSGNQTTAHQTGEIFVFRITNEGTLVYFTVIPKDQYFYNVENMNECYGSYISFINDDKLHFIFEDHPKKYANPTSRSSVTNRSSQTSEYILSIDEGSLEKRIWLDNSKNNIYPSPSLSVDISNNNYIIGSYLKNNFRFAILNYE